MIRKLGGILLIAATLAASYALARGLAGGPARQCVTVQTGAPADDPDTMTPGTRTGPVTGFEASRDRQDSALTRAQD